MICSMCNTDKDMSEMAKSKRYKSGYENRCKSCKKKYMDIYRVLKKDEISFKRKSKYYKRKKEHIKKYTENYRKIRNEKRNIKNKIDMVFKLSNNIRCLIYYSLKNKNFKKNSRTVEILGCSFEEFKVYLESRFESWMNWENYGKYNGGLNYGWDIDHIIPLSSAKTEEDIIRLNHHTNLQPLCSHTNRNIKSDSLNYPTQPSFKDTDLFNDFPSLSRQ